MQNVRCFYRCRNCGAEFNIPDIRESKQTLEWFGDICEETTYWDVCPECGSDEVEENEVDEDDDF